MVTDGLEYLGRARMQGLVLLLVVLVCGVLMGAAGDRLLSQREVLLLKDLEGWDHRAIGAALGFSEGMSRQHVFAARRILREKLGPGTLEEHTHDG